MTTDAHPTKPPPNRTRTTDLRRILADWPPAGPLATLIVLFGLSWAFIPNFGTMRTVSNILNAVPVTGIITIGVTLLMISGEFDLSVGSIMAIGAYIFAFATTSENVNNWLGFVLALGATALLGALNGLLVVSTRIPSFIVTLGTLSIYRGLAWVVSGGTLIQAQVDPLIFEIINGRLDVVNNFLREMSIRANFRTATVWLLLLTVIMEVVLRRTRFGNHLIAIGGNAAAAAAQGVRVNRVKVITFALAGALAGLAGTIDFSQYNSVRVATGDGIELNAIAAAVVGGTLLRGGSGRIFGAVVGVLLISTLRTAVVLLGIVPSDNFEAIVGVGIILAVVLNTSLQKRL
jgi:simple sugar transport system permease protein